MNYKDLQNLDYRVVIKNDRYPKGGSCYVATCPTLGVADDGETVKEALKNIKKTIAFHTNCLVDEGKDIPTDNLEEEFIANTRIPSPFYQEQKMLA